MILLPDGSLLAGTGDKGRIYSVADANHWKLLQKTSDGAQVAALLPDTGESKEYFAAHQPSGENFTGSIFRWRKAAPTRPRRLTRNKKASGANCIPTAMFPTGTKLEFSTRSGNTDKPEKTWSDWSEPKPLSAEIAITSPPARYLQYRVAVQARRRFAERHGAVAARAVLLPEPERRAGHFARQGSSTRVSAFPKCRCSQLEAPAVNLNQLLDDGGGTTAAANPAAAALMAMLLASAVER